MKSIEHLSKDLVEYILSDDREMTDFTENCCETEEEVELIENSFAQDIYTDEVMKILNRESHHVYAKACFLMKLFNG